MKPAGNAAYLALAVWSSLFFLAGLPVAGRFLAAPEGWPLPVFLAWGLAHAAVLGGLTAALGLLPSGERARARVVALAGTIAVAVVAVDAVLYALMGLHLHWTVLRVLGQPGALAMLGLGAAELSLALVVLLVVAVGGVVASRRTPAKATVAKWLAVALALDVSGSLASAVTRFYGSAQLAGMAEALPFAWAPRPDEFLTRLTGRPSQAPAQPSFEPGAFERLRVPLASTPPPTLARQPDVLLVVIESLRASDVDAMPNLEALARRSVVSGRHYASGNCTLTGTFSLYSGLSPLFAMVDETWRSPAGLQAFVGAGYDVTLTQSASLTLGLPGRVLERPDAHIIGSPNPSFHALDDANVRFARQWVSRPRGRPGFLVLFLDSTHWPYALDDGEDEKAARDNWLLHRDAQEIHRRYRSVLGRQDERLKALLDEVERAGRADDLVIVVTGDHGEAFGEHGVMLHGSRLDEAQTRVPLVMHLPGVEPRVLDGPSVHQDVLPTLLGYLGAKPAPPSGGGGVDLLAGLPRAVPPVIGYCGFGDPLGYALIEGDRKVFFTVRGDQLTFKSQRGIDDAELGDQRADEGTVAALARVKDGFQSLLGPHGAR